MSELGKMLARFEGSQPGKAFWQELADFLRIEEIADAEISAETRNLQKIYGITDDVMLRVHILSTLTRAAESGTLEYIVNCMINDKALPHEDIDFVVTRLEGVQKPSNRAIESLKEGLSYELIQHSMLKLLNVWNIDLSSKKDDLLSMLHVSAEFFGRKKSRASKNKKQRMAA
ncbi:MAG: hypothetical protein K8S87_00005, partial [Planctomycetes bacterium]|nr:hypothetical protein [Planctomycetota bacterium]